MEQEYKDKIEKLNSDLTKLTLDLQKEVKELKEDTLVNAQHIKILKTKNTNNLNTMNENLKRHIDNTANMSFALAEISEEQESSNYEKFLKTLLESDFKALQQEMIEETKRELLTKKVSKNQQGGFKIGMIFNLFGLLSFLLTLWICAKYKLLFFA
ncbi:hypothetical protein HCN_1339 [Helicobacter cinaedi PAGU611]|uniref:hypothetical protein n=1 Tax=Helicobacter cinaedi TaxID=213 RepID=UPI00025D35FE|nr:hypothetical protein [Helicobacter cinaedi]QOQ95540.1 hypothetical protein HW245_07860 [Helicobacter cinaedi]BAM12549.1 hypothetical protein HCN_1339 [Helicobacter cinaedi PAGU611]BBB20238.1 hypothetical protein HC081234_14150 [Helicobacter cinaedi]